MSIITLTTDFGVHDAYVAAMKGVILGINKKATIVDVCHTITPQNITEAAYVLSAVTKYFPDGTIHIAVVDPGVGTKRRPVLLVTPQAYFIGPDNGIFNYVASSPQSRAQAFHLNNQRYWLSPLSNTFHGRDIFAPVAANLSLGVPPHELGEMIESLGKAELSQPTVSKDGTIIGKVIHADHFGNLITNIMEHDLPKGQVFIETGGHIIDDISTSYEDDEGLLAIIGSDGRLEVSVYKGSAARYLGVGVGGEVKVGVNKASLKRRSR
jgi:S-adenosylmethionine hydrolase